MKRFDIRNYEWGAAAASALLLILSFPNFEYYQLAWIGLVPLLVVIGRRPSPLRAFILGWAVGSVFFYATCYWLTYSMIHYGGLPTALAYLLLIPGALVVGIFHGLFAALIALAIQKWGRMTVLLAPIFWITFEWVRLVVTGQLWNALGYSQAYHQWVIQPATWGGVYALSFLIVLINSVIALLIIRWTKLSYFVAVGLAVAVWLVIVFSGLVLIDRSDLQDNHFVTIVAVQPNVPMNPVKSTEETTALVERHVALSTTGLATPSYAEGPRLVIWPESPMNFTYTSNKTFQEFVANFTRQNHTSLLFNSLEPAPNDGSYNSALLVNEEGRLISQYDKIRLMPFGEYVPLPQWLPGASLISGIVGEFTPGSNYTLMPFGDRRAGVFICIESAYPWIARRLAHDGADVLINISNDGYLGPTAVMRQHLANAIFRAVENGRPVLRVTNSGLSAEISAEGHVYGLTEPFQADVRVWVNQPGYERNTFYTRHGDLFVYVCAVISAIIFIAAVADRITRFTR
ncbi:MAG TPA: apolipoprotein N-acyltransferase [Pyrinomonadaceae bacterium]|nr:apolipoprotein N-acyltransferase [Pyrinomonadaceae bacterium]